MRGLDEDGVPDNIQSHDQITVEIEMIDQSLKKRPSTTQSNESPSNRLSDSKRNSQTSPKPTKHSVSPLSLKGPDGLQLNSRINQGQSLTDRVGAADEDDQHSLNDRQDDGDHEPRSNDKLHSDPISNKNQSDSEDDGDEEDESGSVDSIDKLQSILNEINDQGIEHLKNEETEQALESLKRAEQILEDYTNEGKDVDRNMIIIVLYN